MPSAVRRRRSTFLVALLSIAAAAPAQPQAAPRANVWSGLALGRFTVGYRILDLTDSSRTLLPDTLAVRAARLRRIPVRVWYPAATGGAARAVTFADVMRGPASGADTVGDPNAGLAARTLSIHQYSAQKYDRAGGGALVAADTIGVTGLALGTATASRRDVPTAPGRHPLVVFAGGTLHSVDENVGLWEYLASFGYVVAAIPTVSAEQGAESAYLPDDAGGLATVTRDLSAGLARFQGRADVDPQRIAAVGFSFGGAAALVLAARDARVRAVVGLDPSFIAGRHLPMLRAAPLFDARRLAVPILDFHRADTATVDLSLVEAATRSRRASIELTGLDHIDFNSYVLLYTPLLGRRGARTPRDSALAVKAATYRAMVETTRLFLDDALGVTGRAPSSEVATASLGEGPVWRDVPRATIRARTWEARRPE